MRGVLFLHDQFSILAIQLEGTSEFLTLLIVLLNCRQRTISFFLITIPLVLVLSIKVGVEILSCGSTCQQILLLMRIQMLKLGLT